MKLKDLETFEGDIFEEIINGVEIESTEDEIIENEKILNEAKNKNNENNGFKKLSIADLDKFEEEHWYYKYRVKMLKKLIDMNIEGTNNLIANIGVGTGRLSEHLNKYGKVVDYDNDKKAIKYVKEKRNIDVVKCDYPIQFEDDERKYDYICLFDLLQYLGSDEWGIVYAEKQLKVNGKLLISIPVNKNIFGLQDKIDGVRKRYDLKEVEELLNLAGLKIDYMTYFDSSVGKTSSIWKVIEKFFDEEKVYDHIPSDNDFLYKKTLVDFENIEKKPLKIGNSLFIVCSKGISDKFIKKSKKEKSENYRYEDI